METIPVIPVNAVKMANNGWIINNNIFIPNQPVLVDQITAIQDWIAVPGNTAEEEFTPSELTAENTAKINSITASAVMLILPANERNAYATRIAELNAIVASSGSLTTAEATELSEKSAVLASIDAVYAAQTTAIANGTLAEDYNP